MAQTPGTIEFESAFGVDITVDRLSAIAKSKGLTIFARIDFARDARDAGLELRPEQLLILGNPKAGTPLLQAAPSVGLDLPLKALVFEDGAGKTRVVINDPKYLLVRHAVPAALETNIQGIVALVRAATSNLSIHAEKTP